MLKNPKRYSDWGKGKVMIDYRIALAAHLLFLLLNSAVRLRTLPVLCHLLSVCLVIFGETTSNDDKRD